MRERQRVEDENDVAALVGSDICDVSEGFLREGRRLRK